MEEEALLPLKGRGHALGLHLETQAESGGSHSREGVCLGGGKTPPHLPSLRKEVGGRELWPSLRTSAQAGGNCESSVCQAPGRLLCAVLLSPVINPAHCRYPPQSTWGT